MYKTFYEKIKYNSTVFTAKIVLQKPKVRMVSNNIRNEFLVFHVY